ncbi:MAG: leucine-rich repeat protein [Coriobacteriales bacterium]
MRYDWSSSKRQLEHSCVPQQVGLHYPDGAQLPVYQCPFCSKICSDEGMQSPVTAHCWLPTGGCEWIIHDDGQLVVRPREGADNAGQLPSFPTNQSVPWYSQRSLITRATFESGVVANESFSFIFSNCYNLKSADLSGVSAPNTSRFRYVFASCSSLEEVVFPQSGFVTEKASSLQAMFSRCVRLERLDLTSFNTSKVSEFHEMFDNCGSLETIKGFDSHGAPSCDMSKADLFNHMFRNCVSLKSVVLNAGERSAPIREARWMFAGCKELKSVDFTNLNFSSITQADRIFYDCPSLEWVPEGLCLPQGASECFWVEKTAAIKLKANAHGSVSSYGFAADNRILNAKGIEDAKLQHRTEVVADGPGMSMDDLALSAQGEGVDVGDFAFGGWYAPKMRYVKETDEWVRDRVKGTAESGPSEPGEYSVLLVAGSDAGAGASTVQHLSRMSTRAAVRTAPSCYGSVYLRFSIVNPSSSNPGGGSSSSGGGAVTPTPEPSTPEVGDTTSGVELPSTPDESGSTTVDITVTDTTATTDSKGNKVDGTVSIDKIESTESSVSIPETITTKEGTFLVTSIPAEAMKDNTTVESVTIPESVTTIGESAFAGCTELTSVTVPAGVTEIKNSTFAGCTNLETVEVQCEVTSIAPSAFEDCTSLTSINVPDTVTTIGESAFAGCTSLTSVTVPAGVTSIESSTFANCTSLETVEVKGELTEIAADAFNGCANLTSMTVAGTVKPMATRAAAQALVIPASVTKVGDRAFKGTGITSVTIPAGVKMGSAVFRDCKQLAKATVEKGVKSLSSYTFKGCTALKSVTVPSTVTKIERSAFSGCKNLAKVTLPKSVKSIGANALYGTTKVKTLTINSKQLTKSGVKNALKGSSVTTVKVPKSKVAAYKKLFTKANAGKSVKVRAI